MHILYADQVEDAHLNQDQRRVLSGLRADKPLCVSDGMIGAGGGGLRQRKSFQTAQDWVSAFFDKGAEEVLGYYADDFVWEDIEFMQTITTKEELYKAFVVFNNSGPESPFGVHKFQVLTYDGGPAGASKGVKYDGGLPEGWEDLEGDYNRFANNIFLGADLDYDEWGYMQWIWKATHNSPFFGIDAAVGKTTVTRGTTTQMYKNGKIVRCRTHWNFREFAMQLGVIHEPDHAWRSNPGLIPA